MGQNSVFSWELWANSNVQSWNLSPGWDKKPKRESQRGWVSTSTGKQLLGQNKEHLTGSLHLELEGRHLVTSTLKSTTSAFSPGACRAGVPFLQGKVLFFSSPFLSQFIVLIRKVEIGEMFISAVEMFLSVQYHMHLSVLLSAAKAKRLHHFCYGNHSMHFS